MASPFSRPQSPQLHVHLTDYLASFRSTPPMGISFKEKKKKKTLPLHSGSKAAVAGQEGSPTHTTTHSMLLVWPRPTGPSIDAQKY